MVQFLSDDWLGAMSEAAAGCVVPDGASEEWGPLRIQQIVTGTPHGDRCYVVTVDGGRVQFTPGCADDANVRLTQDYATAAGLARGELSTAEAFLQGRVRVGGDLRAAAAGAEALLGCGPALQSVRERTVF